MIFLNGCTSAGKSSIAVALQAALDTPHLRLGIDDAFAMLPCKLHNHPDGFFFDTDDRGEIRLNNGVFGLATLRAHVTAAASIARSGINLILDEVVLDDLLRHDWLTAMAAFDVFYVGVHCALSELERRELARGDRLAGQARGQIDLVHRGMHYDLQIDTTAVQPDESASSIVAAYEPWRRKRSRD